MFSKNEKRHIEICSNLSLMYKTLCVDVMNSLTKILQLSEEREATEEIIKSQQEAIDFLTKALCDKYENGVFVYSKDGNLPIVICDGEKLTDYMTKAVSINWETGSFPTIDIEQRLVSNGKDETESGMCDKKIGCDFCYVCEHSCKWGVHTWYCKKVRKDF